MPTELALKVALDANAAAYRRAVNSPGLGDCWDYLVLTATNEKQASGYRQELQLRHHPVGPTGAFLPAVQKSLVVSDPDAAELAKAFTTKPGSPTRNSQPKTRKVPTRIGSGGATLAVLRHLLTHAPEEELLTRRTLLIHSGGLSQRLPAYSPVGKIFAPLPLSRPDGQIATLFDHLYTTLAGLPDRLGPGLLVLAGDVFLLFDHRHVPTQGGVSEGGGGGGGCVALSMRVDPETAAAHGLFVVGPDGRVLRTLQKVSPVTMAREGAIDAEGKVLIDTGILFFTPPALKALIALARKPIPGPIDLYEQMAAAMTPEGKGRVPALLKPLTGIPLSARAIDGEFLHLGTTLQFRDALVGLNPNPAAQLFQHNLHARTSAPIPPDARVYHAVVESGGGQALGAQSLVEHSLLLPPTDGGAHAIGAGSVVSQVLWHTTALTLPPETLYFQCPLRLSAAGEPTYVHVACSVQDDFKSPRFAGHELAGWMKRCGITAADLWPRDLPAERRTMWTARLFPATTERGPCELALTLVATGSKAFPTKQWRKSPRHSMADVLAFCDPSLMVAHREAVSAHLQARDFADQISAGKDRPLASDLYHYATPAAYEEALRVLTGLAQEPVRAGDPLHPVRQARLLWTAAQLAQRPDHPDPQARYQSLPLSDQAFKKIALASELAYTPTPPPPPAAPPNRKSKPKANSQIASLLPPHHLITATSPVRLDLAGGWSDTPPYCYELGGHVVNLAIDLDGSPPVRVTVRALADPVFILESHDLGRKVELPSIPGEVSLSDPFALPKVALHLLGLADLPRASKSAIRNPKSAISKGLHITTECRVPKGSGLGTSSILAATLLAALHRATGSSPSHDTLYEQTLLLEQRLSTGGGWQDQVGGVAPGVKSTTTGPGLPQKLAVEPLALPPAVMDDLESRLVVYYSGQQRLARDILRRVVGRWLGREPAAVLLMSSLKQGAASLRSALLAGRLNDACRHVDRYWELKKSLYPGSTTPSIDLLLLELRPHYLAAGLAGAGGGGFAYFLCKSAGAAQTLRKRLADLSARPGSLGSTYPATINRTGLQVTVTRGEA